MERRDEGNVAWTGKGLNTVFRGGLHRNNMIYDKREVSEFVVYWKIKSYMLL